MTPMAVRESTINTLKEIIQYIISRRVAFNIFVLYNVLSGYHIYNPISNEPLT